MFGSLRDKINNLQENLTTTLRGLSVAADTPPSRKQFKKSVKQINPNAGVVVLEKFQSAWCELHEASQCNATKAEEVDSLIADLRKRTDKQWKGMAHLTGILNCLPEMVESLNELHRKVLSLQDLFGTVEKNLIQLEEVLNVRDFEKKIIDKKFELVRHEQTRFAQLESLRMSLEEKHREKMTADEIKKQLFLKDESGMDYAEDIKSFKEPIPKIRLGTDRDDSKPGQKSLDDIVLESGDENALEEFLNEGEDVPVSES